MDSRKGIIKRRKLLIDWRTQGKFILNFIGISLLGGIISVGIFNFLALKKIETVMYSMRLPDISANQLLYKEMVIASLLSLAIIVITFTYNTKRIIQKIEGPLKRFAHSIRKIRDGELNHHVELRHGDEFQEFAEHLNEMTHSFRHRFKNIQNYADALATEVDSTRKIPIEEIKKKTDAAIADLDNALKSFTV